MSRTLKWILGIVAVLVILAIIAGGVWAWQNRAQLLANNRPFAAQPRTQNQQPFQFGPRGFGDGNGRGPVFGRGFRAGPMMGGRGRFGPVGVFGMGLFFLGGLFRLIVPLLVLVVVAFIFYQVGKRSGTRVVRQETSSPNTPPSEPNPPATD